MKKLIFLFLISINISILYSQETYGKAYNFINGNEYFSDVLITEENNLLFHGTGLHYPTENTYTGCGFIANMVDDSITIDTFLSNRMLWAQASSMVKEGDTVYHFTTNYSKYPIVWSVYKTDVNGDSLGKIVYDNFQYSSHAKSIVVVGDYIYLSGSDKHNDYFKTIRVVKLTKGGQVVKESDLEEFTDNLGLSFYNSSMVMTADSNLALIGYYIEEDCHKVGICKFDTDLNVLWYRYYPYTCNVSSLFNAWPYMTVTSDNGLVFAKEINFIDSIYWSNLAKYREYGWTAVAMHKVDDTGELVWTDTLFTFAIDGKNGVFDYRIIEKVVTMKNGDIVGIGSYTKYVNKMDLSYPYICRYSSEGQLKWEHMYKDLTWGGDGYFRTLKEGDDGSLICVGEIEDTDGEWNNSKYSWVVKLDSNGCFTPGCMSDDTIREVTVVKTEEIVINLTANVAVFPNPATDHINVVFPEGYKPVRCKIFDIMGREVAINIEDYEQIDVSGLNSGLFFIRARDKRGKIAVGKFLK